MPWKKSWKLDFVRSSFVSLGGRMSKRTRDSSFMSTALFALLLSDKDDDDDDDDEAAAAAAVDAACTTVSDFFVALTSWPDDDDICPLTATRSRLGTSSLRDEPRDDALRPSSESRDWGRDDSRADFS